MELTELLEEARHEVINLRRQNELMAARLRMFDEVMQVLHTSPAQPNGQACSPDIAWMLQNKVAEIRSQQPQPAKA